MQCNQTYILNKVNDFIHGGVTGDPIVQICNNINTDVTEEVLGLGSNLSGGCGLAEAHEADKSDGKLVHVDVFWLKLTNCNDISQSDFIFYTYLLSVS